MAAAWPHPNNVNHRGWRVIGFFRLRCRRGRQGGAHITVIRRPRRPQARSAQIRRAGGGGDWTAPNSNSGRESSWKPPRLRFPPRASLWWQQALGRNLFLTLLVEATGRVKRLRQPPSENCAPPRAKSSEYRIPVSANKKVHPRNVARIDKRAHRLSEKTLKSENQTTVIMPPRWLPCLHTCGLAARRVGNACCPT